MTVSYGSAVGWTSAALLVLESDASPLATGPLGLSEIAWVASIFGVGGTVGTPLAGWLCEKFGRRPTLLAASLPMVVSVIFALVLLEMPFFVWNYVWNETTIVFVTPVGLLFRLTRDNTFGCNIEPMAEDNGYMPYDSDMDWMGLDVFGHVRYLFECFVTHFADVWSFVAVDA